MIRREPWRTLAFMAASIAVVLLGLLVWQWQSQTPTTLHVASDTGQTAAAFELATWMQATRLAEMGDYRRFPLLRSSGDLFTLTNGTAVRFLDVSGHFARVEIIDGPYAGRRAWVPEFDIGP